MFLLLILLYNYCQLNIFLKVILIIVKVIVCSKEKSYRTGFYRNLNLIATCFTAVVSVVNVQHLESEPHQKGLSVCLDNNFSLHDAVIS